jgi:hypothetical protein
MPISYTIVPASRLVYSSAWGVLTDSMLRDLGQALKGDSRFDPTYALLADFCPRSEMQLTAQGVASTASQSAFDSDARQALVGPTDVLFGLCRMYQIRRDQAGASEVRVFRAREPAVAWLGLRPEEWAAIAARPPDRTFGEEVPA